MGKKVGRECRYITPIFRAYLDYALVQDGEEKKLMVQIADTLALFALLHSSLKHAHPLPPTIPLFERLFYHQESKHALRRGTVPGAREGPSKRRGSLLSKIVPEGADHLESQEEEMVQSLGTSFNFKTLHVCWSRCHEVWLYADRSRMSSSPCLPRHMWL